MKRLGLPLSRVKAIFISHEHTDHINGLGSISRKWNLPVYITARTLGRCKPYVDATRAVSFQPYAPVTIGGLTIVPFPKLHDGCDPHSFTVSGNGVQVGIFTDIGVPCNALIEHFSGCHAAFLEANYDTLMLEQGRYPYHLKNRIRGGQGHLSNAQALEVFTRHRPAYMSHLLLSHLSRDNNNPELVQSLFNAHAGSTEIIVASRYKESAVFHITADPTVPNTNRPAPKASPQAQLALF
jgi:phosphoribosyl 1,2-cyclic phosphodiesterase